MNNKWQTKTLGELAENISRRFDNNAQNKVVFINTGDILDGNFLHHNLVPFKGLPGQAKKAIKTKDILYSEIRPGNKRHLIVDKKDVSKYVVSTKFMVIKPKNCEILPEYLYLVLTNKECISEFKTIADSRSGTFPQITFDSISYYPIKFPNIKTQKIIYSISSCFTKKIQINQQINQTLEEMAQAIFKSWFVDFDPTKAKIEVLESGGSEEDANLAAMEVISGKTLEELEQFKTKNPDEYKELYETAQHFPSAMQDSELEEIPERWSLSSIGDEYKVVMGQSPKGETYNENADGILFYQGRAEFGWRFPMPRLYTTDPKKIANKEDTLMSVRAPVGDLNIALENCCIGRGLTALRHNGGCASFTYYQIKHLSVYLNRFNSEGTVFGSINQKDLKNIPIIKPCNELIQIFSVTASSIDKLIKDKHLETLSLETLRDELLPKLLSGNLQIDISHE